MPAPRSRATLAMGGLMLLLVVLFIGVTAFGLLALSDVLSRPGQYGGGAPPIHHRPAKPTEAEAAGIRMRVYERGWYGGGHMAFLYVVELPDAYRGRTVALTDMRAATPDGRKYQVGSILPLGTVGGVAVGALTLRVPEAGKGILTLTIPALHVQSSAGDIERLDGPWVVSPVEFTGTQPNQGTRMGVGGGPEIRYGETLLALTYRSLENCPETFEAAATPTPDAGVGQATATAYQGTVPQPTATRVPLPPEHVGGMEPDGSMLMVVSVCSPEPRYTAARVTGPDGNLEPARVP